MRVHFHQHPKQDPLELNRIFIHFFLKEKQKLFSYFANRENREYYLDIDSNIDPMWRLYTGDNNDHRQEWESFEIVKIFSNEILEESEDILLQDRNHLFRI